MEVFVGKIVGRISGKRWVQVHDFTHETRGRLVVAASLVVSGEKTEVEMVEMGRELLARIHELYFGETGEGAMVKLKQALEAVEGEFEGLEMVILAVVGEALYVVANAGGAWARAGGKEGWIIRPDAEAGVKVLSSWAKDQETLVLGNSRFWEELPLGVVKAAVENNEIEAAVETLGAVVHGGEKGEGAVGVVVKISNIQYPISNGAPKLPKETKPEFRLPSLRLPEIRLPKLKLPKLPTRGPVYVVRGDKEAARKKAMWLGIGFLVILVVLVGGWRWSERVKLIKQSEQNKQIEAIAEKFNEAKAVVTLNPARSRELLKEINGEVTKWRSDRATKKDERVRQIVGDWEEVWNEAMGTKLVSPELIVDLGQVREGMKGEKIEIRGEKLEVLDTQGSRLVEVDPEKKTARVVAGKTDLGEAKLLATYPGKATILSERGIVECSISNDQCSIAVKPDVGWGEMVDMGMWGGNIYVLTKNNIWRYQGGEAGYGAKKKWLAEGGDTAALARARGLAIDGSVWVMGDGKIFKYTRGVKESFGVSGVEMAGGVLYTDGEAEKLYVLEPGQKRVVVLTKTGEYERQYTNEALGSATDLAVDAGAKKIYFVAGSKIYEISE